LTDQSTWRRLKPPKKIAVENIVKYRDRQRDDFIDRMIESAQERGLATRFARELGIEPCVAQGW
ncbi:uncharacterized protein BX663DRAFT_520264, partial [Cokeromyces recurvatus]|uniref:uncharacterized protein n=1 Tax=Cokeromyces recurvatus TaxID=90255 RepID=UPI00221F79FF